MSLIKCKECQEEISSDAFDCPKCGASIRKPKRSLFGKIIKYSFVLFNLLMGWWMISGVGGAAEQVSQGGSDAAKAGAAIGTGIGAILIMSIWFFGDFILCIFLFFTRPKK